MNRGWILRLFVALCFIITIVQSASAQKPHFGSWNVINTRVTLAPNFEFFNELQLRSQSFYKDHFYHEVKGGISYFLNKNFSFLVGVGNYITYSDPGSFTKPVTAREIRLWQQITMNQYLERLRFEHRYRVEQRWFDTGYRNRFRYRINGALPIAKTKLGPKTFFLSAFEEIFLTNKEPFFERSRAFAGGGYQFSSYLGFQAGYVYQYDYRATGGAGKHFFQLTLNIDIDGNKSPTDKRERIPGNID